MIAERHSISGTIRHDFSRNQDDGLKKPDAAKSADGKKKEEKKKDAKQPDAQESGRRIDNGDESGDEAQLSDTEGQSSFEIIMYARKVKRIFIVSLTFKIVILIIGACVLGFAAESSPNIDLYDCNYNHRPGFVAFFMVVHAFTFCVMIFLMAYQLFYQLKEKARKNSLPPNAAPWMTYYLEAWLKFTQIPQRVMDLFCLVILLIIGSIALACYALWFDYTLGPYYYDCQLNPLPHQLCISQQNCEIFASMRTMAIGAMFWGGLHLFLLILGTILLGCVIGKNMMDSPEGKALYKKIQDESDLSIRDGEGAKGNANANSNVNSAPQNPFEDEELGYGGEGLVLLNFDKCKQMQMQEEQR